MPTAQQAEVDDLSLISQELPALLEVMRHAGFSISPEQVISVCDLIVAVNVQPARPTNLYAYAGLIAPLICRSAEEQARFHALYETWLRQRGSAPPSAIITPLTQNKDANKWVNKQPDNTNTEEKAVDPASLQKKTRLWPFALIGVMVVIVIYSYLQYLQPIFSKEKRVAPEQSRVRLTENNTKTIPPAIAPPIDTLNTQRQQTMLSGSIANNERIFSVANNGQIFATASGSDATLWDAKTGAIMATLTGHQDHIRHITLSGNNERILTIADDNSARLWDVQTGRQLARMQHNNKITAAMFSPDNNQVVTASLDGSARFWSAKSGVQQTQIALNYAVKTAAYSPNSKYLAIVTISTLSLWETTNGTKIVSMSLKKTSDNNNNNNSKSNNPSGFNEVTAADAIRFSPNGRQLILSGAGQAFELRDATTAQLIRSINTVGIADGIADDMANRNTEGGFADFSSDNNSIIGTTQYNSPSPGKIWDLQTGKVIRQLKSTLITPIQFSPDGRYLTAPSNKGYVRSWDIRSGDIVFEQKQNDSAINQAWPTISQNGGAIAYYSSATEILAPPPSPWEAPRVRFTAAAIPVVIVVMWALWLAWRKHLWLQRRSAFGTPTINDLKFEYDEQELWHGESLKRGLQQLRRHQNAPTHRLNIPASVEATVRHAGYFQAVYANRPEQPEYLVLIDHLHDEDYLRQLADTWVSRIRREGLFVNVFYFYQDPRICYYEKSDEPVSLIDLSARHEHHRLLIISDAAGLFHPISGHALPWLSLLQSWKSRAIITHRTGDRWGYQERTLNNAGFAIVPLDEAGLTVLGEHFNRDQIDSLKSPSVLRPCPAKPLPDLLDGNDERWLHNSPPTQEELAALVLSLRQYLGDSAYLLLSACAVYPNLDWKLTLYLDRELNPGISLTEPRHQHLLRLSRLVWFRHGYMPDYFRLYLIRGLNPQIEKNIRRVLHELLKQVLSTSQEGINLPLATDSSSRTPRWLRDFLRSVPENDPLNDHIFVSTLRGNQLSVALPRLLNQWFPGQLTIIKRALWFVALLIAAGLSLLIFTLWPNWFPGAQYQPRYEANVSTVSLWPDTPKQTVDTMSTETAQQTSMNEKPVDNTPPTQTSDTMAPTTPRNTSLSLAISEQQQQAAPLQESNTPQPNTTDINTKTTKTEKAKPQQTIPATVASEQQQQQQQQQAPPVPIADGSAAPMTPSKTTLSLAVSEQQQAPPQQEANASQPNTTEIKPTTTTTTEETQPQQTTVATEQPPVTKPLSIVQISIPYTATYAVEKSGMVIANATQTLTQRGNNEYSLVLTAKAKGIVSLFVNKENVQRTEWTQENNRIIPQRFYENTASKGKETKLNFDWTEKRVKDLGDASWSLPLEPGMVDPLLLQHVLRRDVQGNNQTFTYKVPDDGKIKSYTIKIIGEDTIETAMGSYETIKVSSTRNKRTTTFWLAKTLRFIPVRMEQAKSGNTESSMVITSVKFEENTPELRQQTTLTPPTDQKQQPTQRDLINRAWQTDVVPFYNSKLRNRYPLSKIATVEASMDDFNQFFGNDGILDRFFQEHLKIYVSIDKTWEWNNHDNHVKKMSTNVLDIFSFAATVREAYFPNNADSVLWQFTLKPVTLDRSARDVTLTLGAQQLAYQHGPTKQFSIQWPPRNSMANVALSFTTIKGDKEDKIYQGTWAWFRLLDDAAIGATKTKTVKKSYRSSRKKSTLVTPLTFSVKWYSIQYELTSAGDTSPLSVPALADFIFMDTL